jgi:hypothetical protein
VATTDAQVKREGRAALRVEPAGNSDAIIRSAPITLRAGKHYELTAWARTEGLEVRDTSRSPIAVGASLGMGSMPFDVHSESLAGTRDWTRLKLRFTASRSQDSILLRIAEGGAFRGRAWFDAVSIEEISGAAHAVDGAAVETFGPAYRYPSAGWIYLHVEGKPYERGYQHGYLMPKEIERYMERCAALLDSSSRERAWENGRVTADALFLRGFDEEIREEMKGIADGAVAAGARWHGRRLDLTDIATANTIVELGDLHSALRITKTGLEGLGFQMPGYGQRARDVAPNDRCSSFAATGKATRDGHMVIAHTTWWSLTLAEQTNVMLDIKPERGRRILMQSYPGGIESGTDWYQNDAGVVLTETTIRQTPFNREGTPVAFRARKAIQYGENIDQVVQHLGTANNGLYTNEWLIGDAKNDEIAMYELGTYRTRLWRSSKNEWFGGTEGFYWGCNNAKDAQVRLEYLPDPNGKPEDTAFWPSIRDIRWREMYRQHKGNIDEQFAFLAYRSGPLVSTAAMDAKVATGEMASNFMVWAAIGKPNQRERLPGEWDRNGLNDGLYPSGYRLFAGLDAAPASPAKPAPKTSPAPPNRAIAEERLWTGWILPAADADLWLTAGAVRYRGVLAGSDSSALLNLQTEARSSLSALDVPLSKLRLDLDSSAPNRLASAKGALVFDALRRELGDDKFLALMREFYAANTTRAVASAAFQGAASRAAGHSLDRFFADWLEGLGIPGDKGGPSRTASEIEARLGSAIIVYGTMAEAGANRYAAEQFLEQHDFLQTSPPIRKDFEITPEELASHDIVFIGRPESNQALAAIAAGIGLEYNGAAFQAAGQTYASEYDGLAYAAPNPSDLRRMVLVLAGNSALETVRIAKNSSPSRALTVYRSGKPVQ